MFRDALGRPEITPHNWISEQSRAGIPDEGVDIAAVGLEHFQAAVAFAPFINSRAGRRLHT